MVFEFVQVVVVLVGGSGAEVTEAEGEVVGEEEEIEVALRSIPVVVVEAVVELEEEVDEEAGVE